MNVQFHACNSKGWRVGVALSLAHTKQMTVFCKFMPDDLFKKYPKFGKYKYKVLLLQVLNVGWSYFILKVAYQAIFSTGSIANDARYTFLLEL
jgi:hypothetical protein